MYFFKSKKSVEVQDWFSPLINTFFDVTSAMDDKVSGLRIFQSFLHHINSISTYKHSLFSPRPKCALFTSTLKIFCITIVFDFSRDKYNTKEKLETVVMQTFGGYCP